MSVKMQLLCVETVVVEFGEYISNFNGGQMICLFPAR